MEIEIIPNTSLFQKDVKKFKLVRNGNGEAHYYVTMVNNS